MPLSNSESGPRWSAELISILKLRAIAESLAGHSSKSQKNGYLRARIRGNLGRQLLQSIFGTASELSLASLQPCLEQILLQSVQVQTE